jgi:large subunit ribosomal protein L1
MAKHGKKYRAIQEKAPGETVELDKALEFIKANKAAAFDETVDLGIRLGIDPKKSEHAVRGTVNLPNGTGKSVKVLVFAAGPAADAAREAGADFVGTDELIEKIKGGWTDFDVAISTPDAMGEVRKLGRVLGPRGLMPNPKTGTVTEDTAAAVGLSKAGKVEFRMDRHGNINVPCGKVSFAADKLAENVEAVISAVRAERPAAAKGVYIRTCTVSSSMGVGVRVNIRD